ncbi:MAG: nucleoside recognition protein [Firmicutes bacterium]|jgi:hypothetical protein|nr:nucleoside recognition protein [Bacillota bacterium]
MKHLALQLDSAMVKTGAVKGIRITLELAKIVVPTTILVALLRGSGVLESMSVACAPLMKLFGLSGDAAIVLISGYFVNLYAATASILALGLAPREIAVLAIMLGFAHSLLVEVVVSRRAGSPVSVILPLRVGVSLLSGMIFGRLM